MKLILIQLTSYILIVTGCGSLTENKISNSEASNTENFVPITVPSSSNIDSVEVVVTISGNNTKYSFNKFDITRVQLNDSTDQLLLPIKSESSIEKLINYQCYLDSTPLPSCNSESLTNQGNGESSNSNMQPMSSEITKNIQFNFSSSSSSIIQNESSNSTFSSTINTVSSSSHPSSTINTVSSSSQPSSTINTVSSSSQPSSTTVISSSTAAPSSSEVYGDNPMILVFDVGNNNDSLYVRLPLGDSVDVNIDWGDGTSESVNQAGPAVHWYDSAGKYTVSIYGILQLFGSNSTATCTSKNECITPNLIAVKSFGNIGITNLANSFYGARRLVEVPPTLPPRVTNIRSMFESNILFNGDIGDWDVSNVTSMNSMFNYAESFNQDIGNWNTSKVTNMCNMFHKATAFNQNINSWDVTRVTTMRYMFRDAISFNQPLNKWDLTQDTDVQYMFEGINLSPENYPNMQ